MLFPFATTRLWDRGVALLTLLFLASSAWSEERKDGKDPSVVGTLTYLGKPLPAAMLMFHPEKKGNVFAVITDDMGRFALPSIPAGSYRISVTASEPLKKGPKEPPVQKSIIPAIYGDPATSALKADIVAGKNMTHFALNK